jgi:hypothetical protein
VNFRWAWLFNVGWGLVVVVVVVVVTNLTVLTPVLK